MRGRYSFFKLIFALGFTIAFTLTVDFAFAFFETPLPLLASLGLFLVLTAAILLLRPKPSSLWVFFIFGLMVAAVILFAITYGFNSKADYNAPDRGKAELYGGKNVLVLVPHEDDELIVASGVMEEYIKYGSDVSLAFVTNGDYRVPGQTRLSEALSVAEDLGIPESKVFFFGYGDRGAAQLYMASQGELIQSSAGFTSTYALDSHPAYNNGNEYKRENLLTDLCDLLRELRPDIIYCTEVEEHMDHSAVSLFLDEAMAEILKFSDDYYPVILKSSCYATAFFAVNDFYNLNLLSTQDPSSGEHFAGIYSWNERIRLPVDAEGLSRSIFGCDTFRQLALHKSQNVHNVAESTINGDRVFWLRDTNSLCYKAQIGVSSGIAKFLNDFKLVDNYDVFGVFTHLSDNTWVPEASDEEKTATVTLAQPSYIQRICLYDDPDKSVNVLNALITFDDGSSIETGPLNKHSVTEIEVNKDAVSSFSVQLLKTQGENAGLTEIEAYSSQADYGLDFIKVMDMQGNFVYDYFTNELGSESFLVYSSGLDGEFKVSSDNPRCSVKYSEGIITVKCPKNESCTITVSSEDGKYSDTVVVSNPGRFLRETGPYFERLVRQFMSGNIQQSSVYQLIKNTYYSIFA